MKQILMASVAVLVAASGATAGGIDRSGQGLGALFEKGRYLELSFGLASPSVSGTDVLSAPTGDVAGTYAQLAFSYKYDISDQLSMALNIDQPFGADILYDTTSLVLGGTMAKAESYAVTGILRYKLNDAFSVHGGLRMQHAKGDIRLQGLAYGGLSGYNVSLSGDWAPGYLVGVAFEKPEIALRVALTYNSAIKHGFGTIERVGAVQVAPGSETEVELPQSINLDFQTGIAKDTLVFGQIRWADWSEFQINPAFFTPIAGGGLVDLEDTVTYTLGVARRFNENWAGSVSLNYEGKGSDDLVSPLAPTNGRLGATLGAVYTMDNMKITAGINYTRVGDARPETGTPDTARASMTGNDVIGVGVKVGWSF
ncbi:OmpP1/FadL family transporter [Rhodobacter calidifons]|uniref:Aromatic hydrocarbon degradation protein n=1 Tax=Rhodobacter calidifons TaxID=2715277 RepID=A0ABX0G857_9RHOB|nr:outer membrane protein transport protein [Rhodobacter calidifons]NHB77465.1 aromatic hydrocarbon degradation protein [Rhodobacter calidifons]